jgi:hypothetical protein
MTEDGLFKQPTGLRHGRQLHVMCAPACIARDYERDVIIVCVVTPSRSSAPATAVPPWRPPLGDAPSSRRWGPEAAARSQVLGAVYLDGGMDQARHVYSSSFPLPADIKDVWRVSAG